MTKKKKILFFADRLPPLAGGVEVHGGEFIRYFENHPLYPIEYIVTRENEPLPSKINPQILFFNSGRWIEKLRELRTRFPHALFIHRTGGNEILKAPLIHQNIPAYQSRLNFWVKTLNETIDVLITNSSYTEDRLKKIGIQNFFYRCVGGAFSAQKFPVSRNTTTLFSATRFVPYKNPLLLIRVFKHLQKQNPSLALRIAGNGSLFEKAKKLGAEIPNLTLLGEISNEEVLRELSKAALYLQLSSDYIAEVPGGSYIHTEGMGRSILEAISSGIYVIAGACGALSEIVSPKRGKLISIQSEKQIADEIMKTVDTLPIHLAPTDDYSWPRLFERYEALYESTLNH